MGKVAKLGIAAPTWNGSDALSVFDAVARWQSWLTVSGTANADTARQYRHSLVNVWADLIAQGSLDPMGITEDDVVEYLAAMASKGPARSMTLRALRSFYGWALERGVVTYSPVAHLKARRAKYGPAPSLDPPDLDRVIAAAATVDPRAPWAIQLQYATACRAGSLVALEPGDIHWDGPSVVFREAKGDKPYEIPLGPRGQEAAGRLLEMIDYTPPKVATRLPTLLGVRYSSYARWVTRTSSELGLPLNTHLLRHTAITRLAEDATVDVRTIMEIANWSDPSLLRRYAAASKPNLRRAVDSL